MTSKATVTLRFLFWLLLILFLGTSVAIARMDAQLRIDEIAPLGVVSFEFCGFYESCDEILTQWGNAPKVVDIAILIHGIDYLYLILYPGLLATSILLLQSRASPSLRRITNLMVFLCGLMALADAIENAALLMMLFNGASQFYGLVGALFASVKFALLAVVIGWLIYLVLRRK